VRNLIPAVLHQCPQLVCEGWVCRSWWPLATHYCQHGSSGYTGTKGNCARKCLLGYDTTVSQCLTQIPHSLTYLDHDHCEGKDIRLLTICPLLTQDLWRCPSRGIPLLFRGTSHRIQVLSDPSKAKISEPRVAGGIHKDIRLGMYQ
jgi:hypothetical protein